MVDFAVSANFGANASKFLSTMHAMRAGVSAFAKTAIPGLGLVSKAFHSIAGQVTIGNLVSRGIESIGSGMMDMVKSVPEFAERAQTIGRTAGIIGTTAENWQRLGYAAKMTDTNVEGLQGAMQKLNRNMADLTVGKGTLMDIVKFGPPGLGKMLRGTHDTTEAMFLLADAFQKTKDPQVRARMAVAAFGKAGQDMIPMLELGRAGMQKLMAAANNVIPDSTIGAASAFDDNLKRVRLTMDGLKSSILGTLIKAANPFLDKLRIWVEANKELVAQRIGDFIQRTTAFLTNFVPKVIAVAQWIWKWRGYIIPLIAAVWLLNAAMYANPIGLIILGLEVLAAGIVLLVVHWKEITAWMSRAWEAVKTFAVGLYSHVMPYIKAFGATLMKYWLLPVNLVIDAIRGLLWLVSKIPGLGDKLKPAMDAVTDFQAGMNKKLTGTENQFGFGDIWKNAQAEAAGAPSLTVPVSVNIDNTAAPGVKSNVRVAPQLTGAGGMQYAAGGAH